MIHQLSRHVRSPDTPITTSFSRQLASFKTATTTSGENDQQSLPLFLVPTNTCIELLESSLHFFEALDLEHQGITLGNDSPQEMRHSLAKPRRKNPRLPPCRTPPISTSSPPCFLPIAHRRHLAPPMAVGE
ncbi:hypothetical protein L1887_06668 [Cichorium endivia]|nr:hypothetical protein L1887_06668 [Cichorium endivia]